MAASLLSHSDTVDMNGGRRTALANRLPGAVTTDFSAGLLTSAMWTETTVIATDSSVSVTSATSTPGANGNSTAKGALGVPERRLEDTRWHRMCAHRRSKLDDHRARSNDSGVVSGVVAA